MLEAVELTPRQVKFLALSATGMTRKDIARVSYLSQWTVRDVLDDARDRLDARNIMEAVIKSIALAILVLEDDGTVRIPSPQERFAQASS